MIRIDQGMGWDLGLLGGVGGASVMKKTAGVAAVEMIAKTKT